MTKKEYLLQYKDAQREVDRLINERARWIARATKVTPTYTGMPHGGSGEDRMQDAVERLSEVEDELNDKIDRLVDLRREVDAAISTIGDTRLETVLRYRYIDDMTFEQMALKMNYCREHVCRLHGAALQKMSYNVT